MRLWATYGRGEADEKEVDALAMAAQERPASGA
jgi:hypothetical protein